MEEALGLFKSRRIIPPAVEDIQEVLGLVSSADDVSSDDSDQKEYDDLVIIETAQEVIDS